MARIRESQPLVPSVLDRLLRDGNVRRDGSTGRLDQLLRDLKQCVRRDLEHLLNTRQRWLPSADWDKGLPEVRECSLVNYGIPDFTGTVLGSPERREAFCRHIERLIDTYEPRFRSVTVRLTTPGESLDRTLRFRIEALLDAEPSPIPVVYDSVLEPVSATFAVEAGRAR